MEKKLLVDFLIMDFQAHLKVSLMICWVMLIKSAYDIKSVTFSVKDQDFTPVNWWLLFNIWNLKKKRIEM